MYILLFNLHKNSVRYYDPHFTDVETEAQKNKLLIEVMYYIIGRALV